MRRRRLEPAIELLECVQHAPHAQDGVAPFARTAAVRGAPPGLDLEPGKSLVADGNLQVGRLGHDRRIGAPAGDERVRAEAGVLFVDDRGHDQAARVAATRLPTTRAASIIAATPPFMSCAPRP